MDRDDARALLALPPVYDAEAVEAAFRRLARRHHPDHGGDPERFKALVESRRTLLAAPPRADASVVFVDDTHRLRRLLRRIRHLGSRQPPRVL